MVVRAESTHEKKYKETERLLIDLINFCISNNCNVKEVQQHAAFSKHQKGATVTKKKAARCNPILKICWGRKKIKLP